MKPHLAKPILQMGKLTSQRGKSLLGTTVLPGHSQGFKGTPALPSQPGQLLPYLYQCGSAPWHGWYVDFLLHVGQKTWRPGPGPPGRSRAGQGHIRSPSGWLCTGPGSCAGCLPQGPAAGFCPLIPVCSKGSLQNLAPADLSMVLSRGPPYLPLVPLLSTVSLLPFTEGNPFNTRAGRNTLPLLDSQTPNSPTRDTTPGRVWGVLRRALEQAGGVGVSITLAMPSSNSRSTRSL